MKAAVTGATGFLGGALARRLYADGHTVTGLGRNPTAGAALTFAGIRFVCADLAHKDAIHRALADHEIVFHCGALSSPWGPPAAFDAANIAGTAHVIAACRAHHIPRLIHVSTPSLYFHHHGRTNVPEDAPLPARPVNDYVRTKRAAETLVQEATADGLFTLTIRPRAIFGPGDNAILPRLIRAAQTGRLRIIGDGRNRADLTYVDNVVDALLLCATADDRFSGRVYNVTDGRPVELWPTINGVLADLGLPTAEQRVSARVAMVVAGGMEWFYRRFRPGQEPPLTRYSVGVLSTTQTLDISAIRTDLGYRPRIPPDEGRRRFVAWWQEKEK